MKSEQMFMVNGQVRPIWRFFFAVAMMTVAYLAVGIILGMVFGILGREPQHSLFWTVSLTLLALLAVSKILTGFFDGRPLGSIGLAFCGRWKAELAIGLLLGAAMILAIGALEWAIGLARFTWNPISPGQVVSAGAYYGLLFTVAAANEEITFRGYPFQRLIDAIGPAGAVVVMSAFFGVVHLENPSHTGLSTFNTALVGVPLAVAYLRTRALWLPIGIHLAWNFVEGYGLGFPVSGIVFPPTLLRAEVHGPQWMTGGSYGPEGGWLATGVIIAGTVYLLLSRSIYPTEEMKKLAFGAPEPSEGNLPQVVESSVAVTESE